MNVTFTGAPEKYAPMIHERATALLMEMEREFAGLKVEISDGETRKKQRASKGSRARKNGQLAGASRKGAAKRQKRG